MSQEAQDTGGKSIWQRLLLKGDDATTSYTGGRGAKSRLLGPLLLWRTSNKRHGELYDR